MIPSERDLRNHATQVPYFTEDGKEGHVQAGLGPVSRSLRLAKGVLRRPLQSRHCTVGAAGTRRDGPEDRLGGWSPSRPCSPAGIRGGVSSQEPTRWNTPYRPRGRAEPATGISSPGQFACGEMGRHPCCEARVARVKSLCELAGMNTKDPADVLRCGNAKQR